MEYDCSVQEGVAAGAKRPPVGLVQGQIRAEFVSGGRMPCRRRWGGFVELSHFGPRPRMTVNLANGSATAFGPGVRPI